MTNVNDQMEKELSAAAAGDVKQAMRNVDAASGDSAIGTHKAAMFPNRPVGMSVRPIDETVKRSGVHAEDAAHFSDRRASLVRTNEELLDKIGKLLEQHAENTIQIALIDTMGLSAHVSQKILDTSVKAIIAGITRTK